MTRPALRERHTELTREAILQALVDRIGADGVHDFSVQGVADAAGVAHRTVYRYFPTREALLEGLNEWLSARIGRALGWDRSEPPLPARDLGRAAASCYRLFEEHRDLVAAFVTVSVGARLRLPSRFRRTAWMERLLAERTAHLEADDAKAATAMVRALCSSTTWHHLREHSKASPAALARAVRWAVDTLIADLAKGGGASPGEEP